MKLYKIIVFLFAFSMFVVALNATGIFDAQMPHQNLTTSTATVTDITSTNTDTAETPGAIDALFGGIGFIVKSIEVLWSIITTIMSVNSLMRALGFPEPVITLIYGMVSLIIIFGVLKWATGRNDKGME